MCIKTAMKYVEDKANQHGFIHYLVLHLQATVIIAGIKGGLNLNLRNYELDGIIRFLWFCSDTI
jgi:hypothetical protein